MIRVDLSTCSSYRGVRRRSEPVHIRDVVAQIRAVLETRRREAPEDLRVQLSDVEGAAQPVR